MPPSKPDGPVAARTNAYLLLTLAPLFWGCNAVAGKLATQDWLPFALTSVRWGLVCLLLLPFAWVHLKREFRLVVRYFPILFLLGGVGQGGFNLCLFYALNHISAVNASIEQAAMPVLIMMFNFVFLRQSVLLLQIVGLLITTTGVALTVTHGSPATFLSGDLNHGDLVMLLGAAFYAAYSFGLRWRPPVHWMSFLITMAFGALLVSLPFSAWEIAQQVGSADAVDVRSLPPMKAWWVVLFIAVFPSILGQLFYAQGVDQIGANRAGLFINLVPIFGALLAVLILGEALRWYHAVGLLLVLGGIALAEKSAQ